MDFLVRNKEKKNKILMNLEILYLEIQHRISSGVTSTYREFSRKKEAVLLSLLPTVSHNLCAGNGQWERKTRSQKDDKQQISGIVRTEWMIGENQWQLLLGRKRGKLASYL